MDHPRRNHQDRPLPAVEDGDAEPAGAGRLVALTGGVLLWAASLAAASAPEWFLATWGPSIAPPLQAASIVVPFAAGLALLLAALLPTFVHFAERRP